MTIRSSREFLLGLLYASGRSKGPEPIIGITRLEKMCFLGRKDPVLAPTIKKMDFEPDNFGPYSASVKDDLEYLKDLGLVEIGPPAAEFPLYDELGVPPEEGPPSGPSRFALSGKGAAIAEKLWEQFTPAERKSIQALKAEYNGWDLDQLVRFVYQTSDPIWISKSTIAHRYF